MNHPGFTSPRLANMRRVLDEVSLSDRDRRVVGRALSKIEGEWQDRHRAQYEKGLAARDKQHDEVLEVTGQFCSQLAEAHDDVRHGRRPAKEVRAWLRDVRADHTRLTDAHRGIEATEDRLSEFEAMDVADFQAEQFSRLPLAERGASTLAATIGEQARQVPTPTTRPTRQQLDADQDALVRAPKPAAVVKRRSG